MAGLSYLQEGGQPEEQQQPEKTRTQLNAKPVTVSGPYRFPTPSDGVPIDRSTLEAMEEMYQDMLARQTGLRGFLEAAKDAQAWWTPGGAQRAQALELRSKAREQQAANLFNMRTQIAQNKAALEDRERFQQEKSGLLGQAGAMAGIDLQPHEIAMLERMTNRADFNKLLQQFAMERTKGLSQPGAAENKYQVLIKDEEGNFTIPNEVPLAERNRLIRSGEGILPGTPQPQPQQRPGASKILTPAAPTPAAPTPAAPTPAAPTPAAPAITPTVAPGAGELREDELIPRAAPASAPPAAGPAKYTFDELTPQQLQVLKEKGRQMGLIRDDFSRPDAAQMFDALPLDKRKSLFSALGPDESVQPSAPAPAPAAPAPAAPAPAAPAPAAPAPAAPAPAARPQRPPTIPEIRAQQELQKQRAAEKAKTEAESEKEHNAAASTAVDRERTASEIIQLVTTNPEVVGVLQKAGVAPALATLLKTGISAPGGHSIGVREIEEVLFKGQKNLTREQIVARDRLKSLLNKTSLHASKIMEGQGSVTQFERELVQNMVGSLENTPENLIKIQKILMENAKNRREIDTMFKRSKMAWGDFVKTEAYIGLQDKYNKRLSAIENENLSFGRPAPAARPAPQPFSADEEAAYQKWKQDQIKRRQGAK